MDACADEQGIQNDDESHTALLRPVRTRTPPTL